MNLEDYGVDMWSTEKIEDFRSKLLAWYDHNKRDLPWRHTKDPYAIWVSEIMSQQTRLDTVIPYYLRFLQWFPTIESLANAPQDKLLKAWEGLGYYSRVRNMQQAAQEMMDKFQGQFPQTYEEILSLKGIGPYTAGAVSSIAFDLPQPAVDGNLMRVISRLFEVEADIGDPANRKIYQEIAEQIIDPKRPGDFNQALMDLGADIESPKNPRPEESPVKEFSAAYLHGTMDKYPVKKPKKKPRAVRFQAFIIQNEEGHYLLEKNIYSDLLSGFWHFPIIENHQPFDSQLDLFSANQEGHFGLVAENISHDYPNQGIPLTSQFEKHYNLRPSWQEEISVAQITHVFSHQKWYLDLTFGSIDSSDENLQLGNQVADKEVRWVAKEDFDSYAFAKPQQKMWQSIQQLEKNKKRQ